MSRKTYIVLSILLAVSFALTACGAPATQAPPAAATEVPAQPTAVEVATQPAATEAPAQPTATEAMAEKVTITWWHITTAENQKAVWQKLADEYMAAHPNVNIEITVLENEAF